MKKQTIRGITVSAIMGAVGFLLMCLEFPMPFIIPEFIKFDFSELPALIVSFAFGPMYGVLVCAVKNILHLFITTSAGVGELSNFLLGAVFTATAGTIYRHIRNRKGALIGSICGAFVMAVISVLTNYAVVYPAYVVIYGLPMDAIIGMYKTLLPTADNLLKALLIFNFPFNFVKGIIDAALCFCIYKKISPVLRFGFTKNPKKHE